MQLNEQDEVTQGVVSQKSRSGWLQRVFSHSKGQKHANSHGPNAYDGVHLQNVGRSRNATDSECDAMVTTGVRACLNAQVGLLDGQSVSFEVEKTLLGAELLRRVCNYVGLTPELSDFFGLKIDSDRLRTWTWLKTDRRVLKQLQKHGTLELQFQVRFYPPDTSYVYEDVLVYQLVLQIRHDLATGQLRCPPAQLAQLAAYALQSEVGDYNDSMYQRGNGVLFCLPSASFAVKAAGLQRMSVDRLLEAIRISHKSLQGLMPAVSDFKLFERACKLQLYGVRLESALDARGIAILIGANHAGVHVYQQESSSTLRRLNRLAWPRIMRIHYQSKRLCVEVREDADSGASSRRVEVLFRLPSVRLAKRAWHMLVQSHVFYRLKTPRNEVRMQRSQTEVAAEWRSTTSLGWWTQSAKSASSLQLLLSPKTVRVPFEGRTLYESRQRCGARRGANRYWNAEKHSQCAAFQSAPCLLPAVDRRPSTRPLPPLPPDDLTKRLSALSGYTDDSNYAVIGDDMDVGKGRMIRIARLPGYKYDENNPYEVTTICRRDSPLQTLKRNRDPEENRRTFSPGQSSDTDYDSADDCQPSRETNIDDVDAIPYDC